jgi:HK97 family phage prohead protease
MADKKEIPMEHKQIEFKFTMAEGDAEPGSFIGYGSLWDVVDSYGDSVQKGAFKKTLREKKQFPLLWSHDSYLVPIGIITGEEDDHGLKVAGSLNLDIELARDVRSAMKQGSVNGLSIGYNVVKELVDRESGIRTLKEINLWEISACVFQACPGAVIAEIKSRQLGEEPDDKSTPEIKPEHIHLIDDSIARIKSYLNS